MSTFIFESYAFTPETGEAKFRYRFDDGRAFEEVVRYSSRHEHYNSVALDRALQLAFLLIGTSYVKTFPTQLVQLPFGIDDWTAGFLNKVYQEGLSQFAYENGLTRSDMPQFSATGDSPQPVNYEGAGILALQSGGKDSLLLAELLQRKGLPFTPWYLSSRTDSYPAVLDTFPEPLTTAVRSIDHSALKAAAEDGAKNGHVPVTYIVQSLALIQAILLGKNEVLVSIAHEGEEPHAHIDGLAITHQWSKTWPAEQLFAEYIHRSISPNITLGSPLRRYSELRVAELFVEHAWEKYGHHFSSCNVANYRQQADNTKLRWCGQCPKCANSYVLFAPYLSALELKSIFDGKDLFESPTLQETFKGLFGVDGVMKPFECIGEVDELRYAYHEAQKSGEYGKVSFEVPGSSFDPFLEYPAQQLAL